jgi:hypothetical protein
VVPGWTFIFDEGPGFCLVFTEEEPKEGWGIPVEKMHHEKRKYSGMQMNWFVKQAQLEGLDRKKDVIV